MMDLKLVIVFATYTQTPLRYAETYVKNFLCDLQSFSMHKADMEKHERLRQARILAGFSSAAEAARRLAVPYGTYSGHENGLRGMKDEDMQTYAKAFKCSVSWLAFEAEESTGRTSVPVIGHLYHGGTVIMDPKKTPMSYFHDKGFGKVQLNLIAPKGVSAIQVFEGYRPFLHVNDTILVRDSQTTNTERHSFFTSVVSLDDGTNYLAEIVPGNETGMYHVVPPNHWIRRNCAIVTIREIYAIVPWFQSLHQAANDFEERKRAQIVYQSTSAEPEPTP